MAYCFETLLEAGVFVARVTGTRHARPQDNYAELRGFWMGVATEMSRAGVDRLLAVISVSGAIRSLNIRTFYRSLGEMGFKANMLLAVVFAVPPHETPVLELGVETAARDGWAIRHFASEAEARAWLLNAGASPR